MNEYLLQEHGFRKPFQMRPSQFEIEVMETWFTENNRKFSMLLKNAFEIHENLVLKGDGDGDGARRLGGGVVNDDGRFSLQCR